MKKFVLLTAHDEPNIAVLSLDECEVSNEEKDKAHIANKVKDKIIPPMCEHFDANFELLEVLVSSSHPTQGTATLRFIDEDLPDILVDFSETWVY